MMKKNTRLIIARLNKGMKSWELAHSLKIHPTLYSMYECRRRKPDYAMQQRIADKLGVKVGDIS